MFCFYYDEVQQSYYGTSNSIEGYLDYIYAHDKYKAAIERGETVTKFSSKKYARHEAKAQRKRAQKSGLSISNVGKTECGI